MKNMVCFILFALSPLSAHAICMVAPLTSAQLTGTPITGEIKPNEGCHGLGSQAAYTAHHFSFEAEERDELEFISSTSSFTGNGYFNPALFSPDGKEMYWYKKLTLPFKGIYKIILSANSPTGVGYRISIRKSTSTQIAPVVAGCPSDTYNNGKLTINSVEVPDGLGGKLSYKATLSLIPLSNPMAFTLDKVDPLQ
ncbi:MAG: hypothetical protein ABL903_04725 [Methylococcales bacterium]